jgi:phage terminase small subunit
MGARGRKSASEIAMPPPPVRLVEPAPPIELPAPPAHLTPETQAWWRAIVADYDLEPHHLKLLEAASDAWDRMIAARELLLAEGLISVSNNGTKAHPCISIERDSRAAFARLVRELDLDEPMPSPAAYMRPPALRSNRRR